MLYTDATLIEAINSGDDTPETIADPLTGEDAFTVTWKSSDAWRGHYDTEPLGQSYRIVRFFQEDGKPREVIREGVSLKYAQDHCRDETTSRDGYFDGYEATSGGWTKVEDGCVCGEWDDVPAGTRTSEVEARISALAEEEDVLLIMLPTSNVFSMAYDLYRRAA